MVQALLVEAFKHRVDAPRDAWLVRYGGELVLLNNAIDSSGAVFAAEPLRLAAPIVRIVEPTTRSTVDTGRPSRRLWHDDGGFPFSLSS